MSTQVAAIDRTSTKIMKFVTLGIGDERYGIEISQIREIIARYDVVPLPKTPDFIEGMISLRGDIIPVVDLRKRFSMTPKDRDEETRIIVVEVTAFTVGVQVDKVYEVLKLTEDDIEPPPPLVSNLKAEYLVGVAEFENNLITILNLEKIFSAGEKEVLGDIDEEEAAAAAGVASEATVGKRTDDGGGEPKAVGAVVTDGGMVEFRGKEYFVGKRQKGKEVEIVEDGGKVRVSAGGKAIKEFDT